MPDWILYVAVGFVCFLIGAISMAMFAATAVAKLRRANAVLHKRLEVLGED